MLCLVVDRRGRVDERGDIGDRVADEVPVAGSGDVHGLVEITAARGIHRDERNVRRVLVGQLHARGYALGVGQHSRRKVAGHRQLVA